jgi:hypothetical protein
MEKNTKEVDWLKNLTINQSVRFKIKLLTYHNDMVHSSTMPLVLSGGTVLPYLFAVERKKEPKEEEKNALVIVKTNKERCLVKKKRKFL